MLASFLFAPVTWAAAAAAAPVIIHLIMRTKPRRIIFPAMRFVRKTHRANISRLRLKHLLLLLLRMAAIALLAVLIARPLLPEAVASASNTLPAAAAVVVDNSASMGYVHQGRSLLDRGKRLAREVVDALPAGSRVAVVPTDGAAERITFLGSRRMIAEQLVGVRSGFGTRPIGPALARALAALRKVELARKELYVVSDMTARSWRDLASKVAPDASVTYIVLNCGSGEDANISLGEVRLDGSSVPRGAEVVVETLLRSAQVGGEVDVRAELGGKVLASETVPLRPGAAASVSLSFVPRQAGVAHGRIFFAQDDPLAMDNARYFTLHVGPPARALIVRDPTTVGRDDPASFLMAQAIAPAGAARSAEAWIGRENITADRLDAARLQACRIVLLTDVSSLSPPQWSHLERFVRAGGKLWIVIGSLVSSSSYNAPSAQRVLPAAVGALEVLAERVGWRLERRSEPMLQPFADGTNPPLSDVLCERRLRLASVAPDADVILRYADGKAAIVTRSIGEGTVVLWNFSPVRGYSNLAGLAQFPILVQRTARLLAGGVGEETMFLWGRPATVAVPRELAGSVMTVRKPGSARAEPLVIGLHERTVSFPADRLGHWTVRLGEGAERVERGFSVNADFAESDLSPVDAEELAAAFPPGQLLIASNLAELAERRKLVKQDLDLAVPLLLVLLTLMTVESFFANRFYRREETHEAPGAGGA